MLRQSVTVTILGLFVAGGLPTCNKSEKEIPTDPCTQTEDQLNAERLLLENYALQKEVEGLKRSLDAEIVKNQAPRNRETEKMEAAERENKRIQAENKKQIERQQLRTKLQTSSVPMKELSKLFDRQNKAEVQYLLGEPDKRTKSAVSDSFFYEIWEYRNKVQETEKSSKKPLFVFFDKDLVNHLETSRKAQ